MMGASKMGLSKMEVPPNGWFLYGLIMKHPMKKPPWRQEMMCYQCAVMELVPWTNQKPPERARGL
jgi:hypothetical protein